MNTPQAKKIIKENLELVQEDAGLILIPLGIIFTLLYVIPFLLLVYANYVAIQRTSKYYKDDALTEKVRKICNYPIEVYVSKADMYNAWNAGTNKVFITEKCLSKLDEKETLAVLLHEVGHYANSDVKKLVFMVHPIGSLIIFSTLISIIAAMAAAGVIIPHLIIIVAYILGIGKNLIINKTYGKEMEFLADSFASQHGYGNELFSALKKIQEEYKKIVCKDISKDACRLQLESSEFWDYHPNLKDRKLNIKLKKPKYTEKVIDGNPENIQLVKLSFFELRTVMNELKSELKKVHNNAGK